MQLDKLQLDLRPRSNAQALDLGFALLHSYAAGTYLVWLSLWLPIVLIGCALALWDRTNFIWYLNLAWWLRALAERAPLYVLSRRVFGENVGWWDALKAWPSQLGGWFSLITWRRLISPMRNLYAPIWQLEGARGKVAAERRRVIGRNGTYWAATWFGVAMFCFEVVLAFGLLAFIGIFLSDEQTINPFAIFANVFQAEHAESWPVITLCFLAFGFAGAVIGPIYVACGFTLYLNRRATLEAWDIEIALRQIQPPQHRTHGAGKAAGTLVSCLAGGLLLLSLGWPIDSVRAAETVKSAESEVANIGRCEAPLRIKSRENTRLLDIDEQQTKVRKQLASLYDTDDLRGYICAQQWVWKGKKDEPKKDEKLPQMKAPDLSWLAVSLKVIFIALAIGLVLWLIYRFRDQFSGFSVKRSAPRATEVAGLDIRPESLPDDVPAQVMKLWRQGERRLALALLYRATISRLVHDNGVSLPPGATEGDCTREAERALHDRKLSTGRLKASANATDLWLRAAYADRWPDDAVVQAGCTLWGAEFGPAAVKGTA